jgi:hypothetical protein
LITRLIKTYSLDDTLCPNILNQKYYKNLKYLMYRRYIEQSIDYEPWSDLITECLSQAEYLIDTFLEILSDNNDYKEIKKWINLLNVNHDSLSPYVSRFFNLLIVLIFF